MKECGKEYLKELKKIENIAIERETELYVTRN